MFHTILVPLDGSDFAEQALAWASSIARRAGARLELVRGHVFYALQGPASPWAPVDPEGEAEWKRQEQLYLDGTARWVSSVALVPAGTAVVAGLEADGILGRIAAVKADLVVMSTHGRGPVGRFFYGGVADDVVRRSPAPVLLVHPSESIPELIPEPPLERVLIPLDGSPLAEEALDAGAALARLMEAPCVLLRVVEPGSGLERGAAAYLDRIAARLREQGLGAETRLVESKAPAEAILAQAGAGGLIALATHGRGGLGRLLLGSVADQVVRAAACPVLVCRARPA